MKRGELCWSDRDNGWEVLIPAVAFKNATSSHSGSKPFWLVLPNLGGLYDHNGEESRDLVCKEQPPQHDPEEHPLTRHAWRRRSRPCQHDEAGAFGIDQQRLERAPLEGVDRDHDHHRDGRRHRDSGDVGSKHLDQEGRAAFAELAGQAAALFVRRRQTVRTALVDGNKAASKSSGRASRQWIWVP